MPTRSRAYNVAGHVFSLEMDGTAPLRAGLKNYEPFRIDGRRSERREIFTLRLFEKLEFPAVKPFYLSEPEPDERRVDVYVTEAGDYLFEMGPSADGPVVGKLLSSPDFSEGKLLTVVPKYSEFCINNALMLQYAFRTATESTLEMHASVVQWEGRGYLFLGRSGTGKSTHSALWLRHIPGTRLLNDDNPVVCIADGVPTVYGTPWSGKTPCYRNERVPIGAIVQINQAPENRIRRMSVPEAVASLFASCSGLKSIRSIGDGLFATIASVIESVPCYLLDCLPDREAAEICHKTVTQYGK
jgi:hypothetical protein